MARDVHKNYPDVELDFMHLDLFSTQCNSPFCTAGRCIQGVESCESSFALNMARKLAEIRLLLDFFVFSLNNQVHRQCLHASDPEALLF